MRTATSKTKRRQRTLGNTKVLFHPVAPETLTWGVTRTRIESNEVIVSDRERTVLDALERPRLLGSLRILAALFPEVVAKLDVQQLVAYALRAGSTASCQRLGALLERVQTGPRVLAPLRRRVESSLSLLSLIPGEPRVGRLNQRWRVIENDR